MFSTTDDIFLRPAAGSVQGLLRSKTGLAEAAPIRWVVDDDFGVRLHLCEAIGGDLEGFNGVRLPADYGIYLAGKPASDLSTLLFEIAADAFAETVEGVPLASIAVVSGGTGYVAPTVVITSAGGDPGTGATATATVASGVVTAITLTNPGSGYVVAPTVTLTRETGTGTDAVLTAALDGTPQWYYEGDLDLTADALGTALAAAISAGKAQLDVLVDVEIQKPLNAGRKTYRFPVAILPEVYTGTEASVLGGVTSSFLRILPTINDFIGGTSNCLDFIPTARLSIGTLVGFFVAGKGFRVYRLRTGTDANDAVDFSVFRGLDFNAGTNPKVWESAL